MMTMGENPMLGEAERAALRTSLERAEQQIKSGDYTEYDGKLFKGRLLAIYRGLLAS